MNQEGNLEGSGGLPQPFCYNKADAVKKGSPAHRAGIRAGDVIVSVNGNAVTDVLDYMYYSYDEKLTVECLREGTMFTADIVKDEAGDLGISFPADLMDRERGCANKCIFCFVDQLPRGMRETLYFKDDDARLSFLQGNYITLTNVTERELQRIIKLRISPLNISVHTTNPELRAFMLGNKRGGEILKQLRALSDAGIQMNCQIVVCPRINDGSELQQTMHDLAELYPSVASVSVVPVGLTRYRKENGLFDLRGFTSVEANELISQTEAFSNECMVKYGTSLFYPADELYIKAGLYFPEDEYYEDYPQLQNGVGMARLLITEFSDALSGRPKIRKAAPFTAVTGTSAALIVNNLLETLKTTRGYGKIEGNVIPVINRFFGEDVNVAGLVTGGDIINALENNSHAERILLPRNMLRHGESVFLDDVSLNDITKRFGVTIRIVEQDGVDLLRAMIGYETRD